MSEGGSSSGLGSVQSMDEETLQQALQETAEYERQHPEECNDDPNSWLAEKLGQAAAQLVAPGSLLEHVTLRCSLSAPNDWEGKTGEWVAALLTLCSAHRHAICLVPDTYRSA